MNETSEAFLRGETHRTLLRLFAINDVYSILPVNGVGGMAELSTLLNEKRKEKVSIDLHNGRTTEIVPPSFFFLNGDFLSGSELGERFQGEHMIQIMNKLKTDAVVVGNHEFDFGVAPLQKRISESDFPYFGSNIIDKSTNKLLEGLTSHRFINIELPAFSFDGSVSTTSVRVALFGICTEATPFLSYPGDSIRFEPSLEHAKSEISKIKSNGGADIIICLSHLNYEQDLLLAQEVPEINVVLGGHDHHVCQSMEGNTLVLKCGQNAYWLGVVNIIMEVSSVSFVSPSRLAHQASLPELAISVTSSPSTSVVKRLKLEWQVIPVVNLKPDPNISSIISHYLELYKEQDKKRAEIQNVDMEELLVTLEPSGPPLDTRSSSLRFREGSGGNLVADSMRFRFLHYTCTGIPLLAVINGGHVRGDKVYPPGSKLLRKDMEAELPFPRQVVVVLMRVPDLVSALERMISRAIPNGSGAYPHISSNGKLKYKIVETETSAPSTPSGSSTSTPASSGSSTPASSSTTSSATSSPITPSVSVSSATAIHHKEAKIVSFEVDGNQKGKEEWLYVVITEFMEMGGDEIPEWRLSSRIPAPAEAKDRTSEMRTLECVLGYLRSSSTSTSTNTRTYTPVEEGRVLKEE